MAESEGGTPTMPATPGTPGTPGAPLFTSLRVDSLSYERSDRKTAPRCMCFPVGAGTWGGAPHTCFGAGISIPDVSLTRKVLSFLDYDTSQFFA